VERWKEGAEVMDGCSPASMETRPSSPGDRRNSSLVAAGQEDVSVVVFYRYLCEVGFIRSKHGCLMGHRSLQIPWQCTNLPRKKEVKLYAKRFYCRLH
jgi:hypothetical protein